MTPQAPAAPIRVLVVGLPRMLSEIVHEIVESQGDMAVTESPRRGRPLLDHVDEAGADVLICPREQGDDCRLLLWTRPRLKVISLSGEGREAQLHELRHHERLLGNLAPDRLLAVIRSAVRGPVDGVESC
jgi:DNA-binding NarL/FixJ family response regulator